MLRSEDLMIGDWVNAVYKNVKYPMQVEKLDYDISLRGVIPIDDWQDGDSFDEIEPIPLTPEILEKNGFRRKKDFMQLGNFDNPPLIMWHLEDDKILHHQKHELGIHHAKEGIHVSFKCEYIHEFQHALKLCSIKKEIVL